MGLEIQNGIPVPLRASKDDNPKLAKLTSNAIGV